MTRFILALIACVFITAARAEDVTYKFGHWTVVCAKGTQICGATTGARGLDPADWVRMQFYPGKQHDIIFKVPAVAKARDSISITEGSRPNGVLFMERDSCNEKECAVHWSATPHDIRMLGMVDTFTVDYSVSETLGHYFVLSMDGFNEAFAEMQKHMLKKHRHRTQPGTSRAFSFATLESWRLSPRNAASRAADRPE